MEEKQLKIYIDENLPHQIAAALDIIQGHLNEKEAKKIRVLSIRDEFGAVVTDEDWIPEVGKVNGIVITFDRQIQHTRSQRELYLEHGVGVIFFKMPKGGMSFWQMFTHIVDRWEEIKQIARKNKTPFSFRQPGSNKGFEEWKKEE
jgi:hypothetical protein